MNRLFAPIQALGVVDAPEVLEPVDAPELLEALEALEELEAFEEDVDGDADVDEDVADVLLPLGADDSPLAALLSTPPIAPEAGLSWEPPRKSVTYQPEPFN